MKQQIENMSAYQIVEKRRISDLNSEGYILKHKKTGASVVLLLNDDENKVFYIGFRTPPKDSTGFGAFCAVRFKEFSGKGSLYRTCQGFTEHLFECHDLSG